MPRLTGTALARAYRDGGLTVLAQLIHNRVGELGGVIAAPAREETSERTWARLLAASANAFHGADTPARDRSLVHAARRTANTPNGPFRRYTPGTVELGGEGATVGVPGMPWAYHAGYVHRPDDPAAAPNATPTAPPSFLLMFMNSEGSNNYFDGVTPNGEDDPDDMVLRTARLPFRISFPGGRPNQPLPYDTVGLPLNVVPIHPRFTDRRSYIHHDTWQCLINERERTLKVTPEGEFDYTVVHSPVITTPCVVAVSCRFSNLGGIMELDRSTGGHYIATMLERAFERLEEPVDHAPLLALFGQTVPTDRPQAAAFNLATTNVLATAVRAQRATVDTQLNDLTIQTEALRRMSEAIAAPIPNLVEGLERAVAERVISTFSISPDSTILRVLFTDLVALALPDEIRRANESGHAAPTNGPGRYALADAVLQVGINRVGHPVATAMLNPLNTTQRYRHVHNSGTPPCIGHGQTTIDRNNALLTSLFLTDVVEYLKWWRIWLTTSNVEGGYAGPWSYATRFIGPLVAGTPAPMRNNITGEPTIRVVANIPPPEDVEFDAAGNVLA